MSAITPAASVLLTRGPEARAVYSIRRGARLRFFGGFWAFPGGRLDPTDGPLSPAALLRAACRELFEEVGVLLARHADGSFPTPGDDLDADRRAVLAGELAFEPLLARRGLTLCPEDFVRVSEVTTPPFAAVRFATTFFVAHVPPEQRPEVWPGELDAGEWVEPSALLDDWRRGTRLLTPPTMTIVQALGDHSLDEAPARVGPVLDALRGAAMHPIYFAPTVQLVPLRTVALPPSTHTNALLVGAGPRYLIDPGPDDPAEQRVLFDTLDEHARAGRTLDAVVLSHAHPDHVGAAAVCAARYNVPVWAHALTAERLRGRVTVTRTLDESDRLDLGPCPIDGGSWALEVLHTPGHAPDHLTFFERRYGLLLAGDMVSTLTSIVVGPPDGNLTEYLASLRRLRELPARLLLPAHGNASASPHAVLDDALTHRARREQQLLDALAEGPALVDDLRQRLYRGLPETLHRLARAQVLAGLLKLQHEGRAVPDEATGRWRLGEPRSTLRREACPPPTT